MGSLRILSILCCFVVGEELRDEWTRPVIVDMLQSTINGSDVKESGLKLIRYVDRLEWGVQENWKPNAITESCSSLKRMGINETGYYLLNNKNIAFCDMAKNFSDPDIQREIWKVTFKYIM